MASLIERHAQKIVGAPSALTGWVLQGTRTRVARRAARPGTVAGVSALSGIIAGERGG